MGQPYRDQEWLERKYVQEGLTQLEIADQCDVSPRTIRTYMNHFGIETRELVGENHPLYGKKRSAETKEKISRTLEGRSFSKETLNRLSEAHKGNRVPEEARRKISESLTGITRSEETRLAMSRSTSGKANPQWKHGLFHKSWYGGSNWGQSRKKVRQRDQVCQNCGSDRSESLLDVHHIVPLWCFELDETLSVDDAHHLGNLILLCRSCHIQAEDGDLLVTPNFDEIPRHVRNGIRRLWLEWRSTVSSKGQCND